jgi:di/tricarboxylate transporter
LGVSVWIAFGVAIAVFLAMASDRIAPHRAALGGAALLLLTGTLDTGGLLAVVGSSGLLTISCMMLVAAALEHTGLVDRLVRALLAQVGRRPRGAWLRLYAAVLVGSSVLANTPTVVLAVPAVLTLARHSGVAITRVLLPIVFLASLGGGLTLIGSSVNLIASESLLHAELPGLGLFEFSLLGLACAAVGVAYLLLAGPRLLPSGPSPSRQLFEPNRALVALLPVGLADPWLQQPVTRFLQAHPGVSVLDCVRAPVSPEDQAATSARGARISLLADLRLQAGDALVVEASAEWLLQQAELRSPPSVAEPLTVEVWLPPQSRWLGLNLQQLRLDRIFGIDVLGIAGARGRVQLPMAHRLEIGDRLLLRGPRTELERVLASEVALGPLQVERASHACGRQWVALLALSAVLLPAFGLLQLPQAALLAALIVVLGGAVSPVSPLNRPSMRTLGLVFGMLAIGESLVRSGAVDVLSALLEGSAERVEPVLLLGLVLLVATSATEVLTNGAAVALLAPVVVSLCIGLGLDPRPFVIAVLFGASASFASPLAYQTNTFVYQIGGYRFGDFLRLGLPLKLLVCAICWLLIPQLWSLG